MVLTGVGVVVAVGAVVDMEMVGLVDGGRRARRRPLARTAVRLARRHRSMGGVRMDRDRRAVKVRMVRDAVDGVRSAGAMRISRNVRRKPKMSVDSLKLTRRRRWRVRR